MANELSINHTNALTITQQYPENNYNLLVPMKTVAEIAEIHKPVMNVVQISINKEDKEIYLQEKGSDAWTDNRGTYHEAKKDGWALTKKGLNKLMRAAGIKILETHTTVPSTCQKCIEANKMIGRPAMCGNCGNKDIKYEARISVPQLTGENIEFVAHKEIIVDDAIVGMKEKQVKEFMKFRSEMCESKAINRALRAAMHIKGTYTLDELKKPFVVAYLVPNLDNEEVKVEAIKSFFGAAKELYGVSENISTAKRTVYIENDDDYEYTEQPQIEQNNTVYGYIPEEPRTQNQFQNQSQAQTQPKSQPQSQIQSKNQSQSQYQQETQYKSQSVGESGQDSGRVCSECGKGISEKVESYSTKKYGRPLCYDCQNKYKSMGVR